MDRAARALINGYYAADKELRDNAWNENNPHCRCIHPLPVRTYLKQKQCLCGRMIYALQTSAAPVRTRQPGPGRHRLLHGLDSGAPDFAPRLGEVA